MLFALYTPAVMVLIVGAVRTGPDAGYPLRPLRACHHPAGGEMGGGSGRGLVNGVFPTRQRLPPFLPALASWCPAPPHIGYAPMRTQQPPAAPIPVQFPAHPQPAHPMSQHSPMMQRIVKFWLPLAAIFLGLAWFSQWHFDPDKEAKAGLERLNRWRAQAGLQELRANPALTQAAQHHAAYLGKDAHGHNETNRSNPHYTGADPQARATAAGYPAPVVENLSTGNFARSGIRNTDSLMTALYHRLALLNPDDDEAGAAWVRGRHAAFVIVQGSSRDRELCAQAGNPATKRYILTMQCNGQMVKIPLDAAPRRYTGAVKYPAGGNIEPAYDGKEIPNPMPGTKAVGNPVSIAFYGQQTPVAMRAFTLRSHQGEIRNPTILSAATDRHHLMQANEFALFAPEPLAYDTEYTAEFHYTQDGKEHTERWTFRTRKRRTLEW